MMLMQAKDDPIHNLAAALTEQDHLVASMTTSNKCPKPSMQDLARWWGIGLETAQQTKYQNFTEGLRTVPNSTLAQWFWTNDRQFCYHHLQCDLHMDMLGAETTSHCQNRYIQFYSHRNTWYKAYTIRRKSNACETLLLFFVHGAVPNTMIMDGAKEQIMGEFKHRVKRVRLPHESN